MDNAVGISEESGGEDFYYLFTAAGHRLALPLQPVERLVRAVAITPVPNAARGIAGLINVQGSAVPVMDLSYWFSTTNGASSRTQPELSDHFILLKRASGLVAVWADTVEGVTRFPGTDLVQSPGIRWGDGARGARWQFIKTPNGLVPICDVELLLETAPEDLQSLLVSEREESGT